MERIFRTARLRSLAAVMAAVVALASPAGAQERIAAVVNDEVISLYDVEMRLNMVIGTSNLPDTPEMRRRLLPQLLRVLVDERLKLQEANQQKVAVTDADLKSAIAMVEQQNNMPPGGFVRLLDARGVDRATAMNQLRADIAWIKVIQRLRPLVKIGEDEVDAQLARMKANEGRPEHHLSEIFLSVDNPARDEETRRAAERLVEQLRSGADFKAIARQFSQSPSAATGGDLGWLSSGQLDADLEAVVRDMQPKQMTGPVRSISGYHILLLQERRQSKTANVAEAKLTLSQIFLTAGSDAAFRERVIAAARTAKSCAEFDSVATQARTPRSGSLGQVKAGDLPAHLRDIVLSQPLNSATKPIATEGGQLVLMVCARDVPSSLPTRDQVVGRMEGERLEMMSRRQLRDLRRAAFVDIRL